MYYDLCIMTRDMSFIIVMIYRIQINTIQYNALLLILLFVSIFLELCSLYCIFLLGGGRGGHALLLILVQCWAVNL